MEVALEGVGVDFERARALDQVSLRLEPGARVGVCGRPGAGKTTLLKVLAGLVRPNGGTVRWGGDDAWALSPAERRVRQAGFGMVFQSDALFDSRTVLENVLLPLVRRNVPEGEARERALQALREVGLEEASLLFPQQLSGGMRKRAGIARAVVARPGLLLADDPFSGLDPATVAQVEEALFAASFGRTLVVVLPDPAPHSPLPRWIRLDRGSLGYDGRYDPEMLERER